MTLILVIVLLVLLLGGSFPAFPYSRNWGYAPSGILGTILAIVVIIWLINNVF